MDIQGRLASLDSLQPLSLFFTTTDGIDGHPALGFTRALRKEYPVWDVRIVVFDPSWTDAQMIAAVRDLLSQPSKELEMHVDAEGNVLIPRIEPAPSPPTHVPFNPAKPWRLIGDELSHVSQPVSSLGRVVVVVTGIGPRQAGCWEYVGNVEDTTQTVVGIASGPVASHILVHEAVVCKIQTQGLDTSYITRPLIASTLVALAVGIPSFTSPRRLHGRRALIVGGDIQLQKQLEDVSVSLGMEVLWCSSLDSVQLEACYHKKPSFIFSGTTEPEEVVTLRSILAPRGSLVLWNDPEQGLPATLKNDPYSVGDALKVALKNSSVVAPSSMYTSPFDLVAGLSANTAPPSDLFESTKSYLLVGGLGSLGLHVALWMYEVHLVLFCLMN